MLGDLVSSVYHVVPDGAPCDNVAVSTCASFENAKHENVDAFLNMPQSCERVMVTLCLAQRHGEEMAAQLRVRALL